MDLLEGCVLFGGGGGGICVVGRLEILVDPVDVWVDVARGDGGVLGDRDGVGGEGCVRGMVSSILLSVTM